MKIASKLLPGKLFFNLLAALGTASAAFAQGESATGTVSGVPNGGSYDYTIILNNTSGSVPIGSFWYSWTPTFPPFFLSPIRANECFGSLGVVVLYRRKFNPICRKCTCERCGPGKLNSVQLFRFLFAGAIDRTSRVFLCL